MIMKHCIVQRGTIGTLTIYVQTKLPSLENSTLERLNEFIGYLNDQRSVAAPLIIMRSVWLVDSIQLNNNFILY